MAATALGPSRRWYWLAAGLLLAALVCVALAVISFLSLVGSVRDFQRGPVSKQFEVRITEPGEYVLYLEGDGVADLSSVGAGEGLLRSDTGDQVPLDDHTVSTSYAFGGYEGQAVSTFTIDQPGVYVVWVDEPSSPQVTTVAVGRGVVASIAIPVLLALAAIPLFLAALVAGIVTLVRRRSASRAPAAAQFAYPAQPAAAQPASWQPDPSQRHGSRYWDGTRWTEWVSDEGTVKSDPP